MERHIKKIESLKAWERKKKKWKKDHSILYRIERGYYALVRFFKSIIGTPRKIKFFIQRGVRGWADCDTWCFDWYFSKVLTRSLKYLKETCHSLPTWKEGKTELECRNEWDCILNTIIYTFETAKKISESNVLYLPTATWSNKEYKHYKKIAKESKYPYKVLTKKETKEFEKGFKYFQRYFFSLWD